MSENVSGIAVSKTLAVVGRQWSVVALGQQEEEAHVEVNTTSNADAFERVKTTETETEKKKDFAGK